LCNGLKTIACDEQQKSLQEIIMRKPEIEFSVHPEEEALTHDRTCANSSD